MTLLTKSIRYASIGLMGLMMTACATHECVPPQGMAASRMTNVAPLPTEEDRSDLEKRAVLSLTGQFCEFYLPQVEAALEKVPGVLAVDFKTVKGGAVVTYESGKLSPVALLTAVNSVHGQGYYCKGKVVPG